MTRLRLLLMVVATTVTAELPPASQTRDPIRDSRPARLAGIDLINAINDDPKSTFKAAPNNKFLGMPLYQVRQMLGVRPDHDQVFRSVVGKTVTLVDNVRPNARDSDFPDHFDVREQWPECAEVADDIRDQSLCGSCWAVSIAGVISDRLCIASKGKIRVSISAADLLECCTECGSGCVGGYPFRAFHHVERVGVVSGGSNTSARGCLPYPFEPCEHGNGAEKGHYPRCPRWSYKAPACAHACQANYTRDYDRDKYYASKSYSFAYDTYGMQKEILENGSVVIAALEIFEDFLYYRSGVYTHTLQSRYLGLHAVRLIGWGVEDGLSYWLAANSWNEDWGDAGFFKIRRGVNEANVEAAVNAVLVDLERSAGMA